MKFRIWFDAGNDLYEIQYKKHWWNSWVSDYNPLGYDEICVSYKSFDLAKKTLTHVINDLELKKAKKLKKKLESKVVFEIES